IRCGCGGLCDSGVLCAMRNNVPKCHCGLQPIHARRQHVMVDIWNSVVAFGLVEDSCERCTYLLFCPTHAHAGRLGMVWLKGRDMHRCWEFGHLFVSRWASERYCSSADCQATKKQRRLKRRQERARLATTRPQGPWAGVRAAELDAKSGVGGAAGVD